MYCCCLRCPDKCCCTQASCFNAITDALQNCASILCVSEYRRKCQVNIDCCKPKLRITVIIVII